MSHQGRTHLRRTQWLSCRGPGRAVVWPGPQRVRRTHERTQAGRREPHQLRRRHRLGRLGRRLGRVWRRVGRRLGVWRQPARRQRRAAARGPPAHRGQSRSRAIPARPGTTTTGSAPTASPAMPTTPRPTSPTAAAARTPTRAPTPPLARTRAPPTPRRTTAPRPSTTVVAAPADASVTSYELAARTTTRMTSRGTSYELAVRTTKTYDVPADGRDVPRAPIGATCPTRCGATSRDVIRTGCSDDQDA